MMILMTKEPQNQLLVLRILGIDKCLGRAKESIGSKGFMKRSRKREEVACGVASRLHEQPLMLRTQLFMLHKQLSYQA
ncbi:hypothetical protein PIB30_083358 [Stylosanthes scabra]|uniref:Uncharacterized protein n=1 Tax=Stylosanthes scabra TaxID=79078 RepID=A0ABU6XQQ4_9FABA|nr:hypothetical protein [Stylosanthes scabra]